MSSDRYKISFSGEVTAELRRIGQIAKDEGRVHLFAVAANWIEEELERTPHALGESRYVFGDYSFRCAFVGPLYVEFAVKEVDRVVFIRRFLLLRS